MPLPQDRSREHGRAFLLSIAAFIFVSAALGLTGGGQTARRKTEAPPLDPIAWERGGLRGVPLTCATARFPYDSEGSTIKLKDGTLVHAYNRREILPENKVRHTHFDPTTIVKVESRDGGKTWGAAKEIFRSDTGVTASHPAYARLGNGELAISYNKIDAVDLTDPKNADKGGANWLKAVKRAVRVFRHSSDEGRTWSGEVIITPTDGYWTAAHDRLLVLSSGRVIQPLHSVYSDEPYKIGVRVARSDDHGRTWKISDSRLSVEKQIEGYAGRKAAVYAEASVIERADKSLLLMARTLAGQQYLSTSTDAGATWSNPYPSTISSPEAPARMVSVPNSNDLLVMWSSCCVDAKHSVLGERLTLSSAISTDGGATWKWRREFASVAPGTMHGADYPSIYFDGDKVFVAYSSGAKIDGKDLHQYYMAVLPLQWFYAERDNQPPAATMTTTRADR